MVTTNTKHSKAVKLAIIAITLSTFALSLITFPPKRPNIFSSLYINLNQL